METTVKSCVLTAHNGKGWYPKGQQRLINSLVHHGCSHDIVALEILPNLARDWTIRGTINGTLIEPRKIIGYKSDCVYTLKAAAFEYVRSLGYDTILWLDCSVWAIKDIEPVFDTIATQGHYFWRSGWTLGQTTSQKCLDYFMISREEAFDINDCSTSMFGLKLSNPDSSKFLEDWLSAAAHGIFHGSRAEVAGKDDSIPRQQKFEHRQDQSVATCLIHLMDMTMHEPGHFSQYGNIEGDYPESVCLVMRGI